MKRVRDSEARIHFDHESIGKLIGDRDALDAIATAAVYRTGRVNRLLAGF